MCLQNQLPRNHVHFWSHALEQDPQAFGNLISTAAGLLMMQEVVRIWGSAASQQDSASQEAHPACALLP